MRALLVFMVCLPLSSVRASPMTIDCEFTYYQFPFFFTSTELKEDFSLGEVTKARFYNTNDRTVANKPLSEPNTLYAFELDEGSNGQNIIIHIFSDLTATATNPQDPLVGSTPGICHYTE